MYKIELKGYKYDSNELTNKIHIDKLSVKCLWIYVWLYICGKVINTHVCTYGIFKRWYKLLQKAFNVFLQNSLI